MRRSVLSATGSVFSAAEGSSLPVYRIHFAVAHCRCCRIS